MGRPASFQNSGTDIAGWPGHLPALKDERVVGAPVLRAGGAPRIDRFDGLVESVLQALYAAKVCSYAQGMSLLRAASEAYAYELTPAELARIWKGGCIIRARLLGDIQRAFTADPALGSLLLDEEFRSQLADADEGWRRVVTSAKNAGLPFAAMSASLDYYDAYRSDQLPMNLTQAQRDYFGAHTYRRIDRAGVFHTQWERGAEIGAATSDPADG